jgi:hypothetical protein
MTVNVVQFGKIYAEDLAAGSSAETVILADGTAVLMHPLLDATGKFQPSLGGTGLDTSVLTGFVHVDTGAWSVSKIIAGVGDRELVIGDDAGLSNNNVLHSLVTMGRALDQATGEGVLCLSGVVTTGTSDKSAFYNLIYNSKAAGIAGNIIAGNFEAVKNGDSTNSGGTYAVEAYAHHYQTGDDGPLYAMAAELLNRGTVGSGSLRKDNLTIANHLNQVTTGINFVDGHTGTEYGWESGVLMADCGYVFLSLNDPTGYPFGTATSTMGIVLYNHANWKSALSIPNDVWIHGNTAGGSLAARPLIKANSDDATLSLGVTRTAAGTPGNFAANTYVLLKDVSGNACYIPAMTAAW